MSGSAVKPNYNGAVSWIAEIIREKGGAVPFSEFMNIALYHPVRGYYSQSQVRYGRAGDFLTAPTASPWYGRVFSHVLERLARKSGPLVLVDLASGDGSFLEVVLGALGTNRPQVIERVIAVDQSAEMRRRSKARIGSQSVEHSAELGTVPRSEGAVVLHACELFDALPVDRVVRGADGLSEYWVAAEDDTLVWEERPVREEVAAYFDGHHVKLCEGQIAESSRRTSPLHRDILEWAGDHGIVFVLDYGYDAHRLYDSRGRAQGSLACYSRHELSRDPLARPGEQDLTAHVNWDDLRLAAGPLVWRESALWPLAEFLVRAGLAGIVDAHGVGMEAEIDAATYSARQEIKRLLDPEGMGSDLKVLIQGKGAIARVAEETLGISKSGL